MADAKYQIGNFIGGCLSYALGSSQYCPLFYTQTHTDFLASSQLDCDVEDFLPLLWILLPGILSGYCVSDARQPEQCPLA